MGQHYLLPALLLCGVVIVLVAGCARTARDNGKDDVPPPIETPAATPPLSGATVTGTGYRIVFPDDGPRVWVAEVEHIEASTDTRQLALRGVTCRMYRDGQEVLQVSADSAQAVLDNKDARVTLTGQVRAVANERDLHLTAETLRWTSRDDSVVVTQVQWLGLGFEHRAAQGTLTTDLTRASFSGDVRTNTLQTPTSRRP